MKKAIIVLACLLFLTPAVMAGWTGTTADRNLSYNSGNSQLAWYSIITKGPEGNLYCVWIQGTSTTSYELFFGRSTDNGATWSSETSDVMINANDGQSVAHVASKPIGITTDSQGNIYVVWAEDLHEAPDDIQEIMFLKSTDQGATWIHSDTDFNISFDGAPAVNANDPDIAADGNDNLYVVWHQDIAETDTSEIHISISTDGGATWSGTSADRAISFRSGTDALYPDIDVAPNNDIYVVWREYATPGDINSVRIQYGKSTDGGATFSSETADLPISTQVRSSTDPIILIDNSGNINVLWQGSQPSGPPFELYYSRSTDDGATWSGLAGPQIVDFGADDGISAFWPGMGVTSGGCLIVVWDEAVPPYTTNEIWASYSTDGGLTWSGNDEPDLVSFPDGSNAYRPDVVAGTGDTLHVIWNERLASSGSNYYDILYSKGDTLTFCAGAPPTGRCCYNNNMDCVDTTQDACSALNGAWSAGLNCTDDPCTSGGTCDYAVGDVNGSDSYNGLDITYGVAFFKGGPGPLCPDCPVGDCNSFHYCGDVNNSCSYNGLDITYGVAYFKGGPGPIYCVDCPPN